MTETTCPESAVHVALLPSSGMGHLTPFLRLAAFLAANGIRVTFIAAHPTISEAESRALASFFSAFNEGIILKKLHLLPMEQSSVAVDDPFYNHMQLIRRSSHLLTPLFSSASPPLSGIIMDMSLITAVLPITRALGLPSYVFFTSSAKMLTLFISSHKIFTSRFLEEMPEFMMVPGQEPMPTSWVPASFFKGKTNFLRNYLIDNGREMADTDGILINTFEAFEHETVMALNAGKVISTLPAVVPIGPLAPLDCEEGNTLAWLDDQPSKSVVFISFGSRTAVSREQATELGNGLIESGCRFIWVVKDMKVDREDEVLLDELLGKELIERLRGQGLVVKGWLNQSKILAHRAIGGFLSHCGWNSITEAAWNGVPVLAWPQHGDQRINASLVERNGIGMWVKSWDWGKEAVVTGEEIAYRIRELMGSEILRSQTLQIKEAARSAVAAGGSSTRELAQLIEIWKRKSM